MHMHTHILFLLDKVEAAGCRLLTNIMVIFLIATIYYKVKIESKIESISILFNRSSYSSDNSIIANRYLDDNL